MDQAASSEIREAFSLEVHDRDVNAVKSFTQMDSLTAPEAVDVETGLRDTVRVLAAKARAKGAAISLHVEPGLPRVYGVAGELNQVWLNLIDNALDVIPGSGQIQVSARRELDRVVVRVSDDGPGIPPEIETRIFDAFFTTKPPGQGIGLGLEITRRLVRRYQGDIAVESRPGQTEFRVSLATRRNGVHRLYSDRVATPSNSRNVVALVDVFGEDCKIGLALLQNALEFGESFRCHRSPIRFTHCPQGGDVDMIQRGIEVASRSRGTLDITTKVESVVVESGITTGLAHLFLRHTSASLILCENADPAVRRDLETFMSRCVPDGDPEFEHSAEGPDDIDPQFVQRADCGRKARSGNLAGNLFVGTPHGAPQATNSGHHSGRIRCLNLA